MFRYLLQSITPTPRPSCRTLSAAWQGPGTVFHDGPPSALTANENSGSFLRNTGGSRQSNSSSTAPKYHAYYPPRPVAVVSGHSNRHMYSWF